MTTTLERTGLQTHWPTRSALGPPPKRNPFRLFGELPVLLFIAFAFALLAKTFFVQAFYIPSESMYPTLIGKPDGGDRVIVNKLVYRFREPRRGEVIVFIAHPDPRVRSTFDKIKAFLTEGLGVTTPEETDFIKRVIGLPGDTIEVTSDDLFITPAGGGDRVKLDEPYIELQGQNLSLQEPLIVPDGYVFVMGDNRNNSADSRSSLGPVPIDRILGKAFVKVWPLNRIGLIGTPTYAGSARAKNADADGLGRLVAVPPLVGAALISTAYRRRRAA